MDKKDPYRFFRIEARELLTQLGEDVLKLERADDAQRLVVVGRLLRAAHTLKGAARVVRLPAIADDAHAFEDVAAPLRERPADKGAIDALLERVDAMTAAVAALDAIAATTAPTGAGAATAAASASAASAPVAVPGAPIMAGAPAGDELEALLQSVVQAHGHLDGLQQGLSLSRQALATLQGLRGAAAAAAVAVEPLRRQLARLEGLLDASMQQLDRELQTVREGVEQLRLVPAARLFAVLQRAARDAAHALGKQLRLDTAGGAVRLDAAAVDLLQAALLQMVRNAAAHGIEAPAERSAAGKPAEGRIELIIERRGQRLELTCRDDGAGVDVESLRRTAAEHGWTEAASLDDAGLLRALLRRGGLSTTREADQLSGRGVGLDVIRAAADRLGGTLTWDSERGRGSTLRLSMPLQLAALQSLGVEVAGQCVYLPLDDVHRVLRAPAQIDDSFLDVDDARLPYLSLARLLSVDPVDRGGDGDPVGSVLVVAAPAGHVAVGVERLSGIATVVLRPPPALVAAQAIVAGVSLDARQRPRLVLDAAGLLEAARRLPAAAGRGPTEHPSVLVVDDSLTTRMLEQSILEAAGYRVELAASAEAGLEIARAGQHALFLVDVEMPGMDGFGFVETTRADARLRDTPAVLISSRDAPADKRRGLAAGASAYIVKSEFDQPEFLRLVRELTRAPEVAR